jgi:small subunit ribosomal protein S20
VPKIKSAIKRVKISLRNQERNKSWRSAVRTVRNKVTAATEGESYDSALSSAYSVIDRAVSKGVLHKNSAARKKSKLAKIHGSKAVSKTAAKPASKTVSKATSKRAK